jgi:hypothetical protein
VGHAVILWHVGRVVPHCVKWCLWRERNVCHFEDCERTILALNCYFFQSLFEWVVALGLFSISSLVELIAFFTFHGSFYCPTVYF